MKGYIDFCKVMLDANGIPWAEDATMNGETLCAHLVSVGFYKGHVVGSAYSRDVDIVATAVQETTGHD